MLYNCSSTFFNHESSSPSHFFAIAFSSFSENVVLAQLFLALGLERRFTTPMKPKKMVRMIFNWSICLGVGSSERFHWDDQVLISLSYRYFTMLRLFCDVFEKFLVVRTSIPQFMSDVCVTLVWSKFSNFERNFAHTVTSAISSSPYLKCLYHS